MGKYASVLLLVAQAYQCQLMNVSPDASAIESCIASTRRDVVCHATLDAGSQHKGASKADESSNEMRLSNILDEPGVASNLFFSSQRCFFAMPTMPLLNSGQKFHCIVDRLSHSFLPQHGESSPDTRPLPPSYISLI